MRVVATRLWRGRRMSLTAAVLIATLTSCDTASSGGNGGPPPTTPLPPLTTSALSDSDAVVTAYKEFWTRLRYVEAEAEKDWESYLGDVAVDPQLRISLQATRFQKMNGITLYGEVVHRITDVDVDEDTATIEDCQDASKTGQADAETGKRNTVGVERDPVRGQLQRTDPGQWKVSEITFLDGEC